ncbi:CSEP0272 putative effector protein [Blumeria hordei DH14]|uniref:CSEP0272 putative effector protein n=1 Tax=Blumeria graminis f. sp. hordei (strain DH14) TaxID=546991 RepID=N1JQS3_BLUG1|nr:CSEP0272 putative effector protein [Blumeria hordei DH14]
MKCTTFASITAILSLLTHAFAVKNYICNGERVSHETIGRSVAIGHEITYNSGNIHFQNPSRDKPASSKIEHTFNSNPHDRSTIKIMFDSSKNIISVIATIAGIEHICHPEV